MTQLNELAFIDLSHIVSSGNRQYPKFSSTHEKFMKINYILGYKSTFINSKEQKTGFSEYSTIHLKLFLK